MNSNWPIRTVERRVIICKLQVNSLCQRVYVLVSFVYLPVCVSVCLPKFWTDFDENFQEMLTMTPGTDNLIFGDDSDCCLDPGILL